MSKTVDLSALYTISGGNIDFEKKIFKEFISSVEEKLGLMHEKCVDGESKTWHSCAHSIKGISVTIGANKLSEISHDAQENAAAPAEVKSKLLSKLQKEYALVKEYLKNV